MIHRRSIVDFFIVLGVSSLVFLLCIANHDMGFWEPWETSTLLAAQHMAQSNIIESSFWVPQVGTTFVAQPLLQLWSLALILHINPDPDASLMRLPGALAGIFLVLMTFFAVRQASTRRAAWIAVAVLLTLPMFVLGGKLIHGDIWLILALSLPVLCYILAAYASTRRMHRTMLAMTGLSFIISFLAGGLFALAALALMAILYMALIWNHPKRNSIFTPFKSRYFLVSLYTAFIFCACIFGCYVSKARYALEMRTPMTLSEINDALDADRVIAIERRDKQIIGSVKVQNSSDDDPKQVPFVLVESHGNLSTNATIIFELNESERRTFVNDMMWRFQKKSPARAEHEIPTIDGAFQSALRFFWYHTNTSTQSSNISLARAVHQAIVHETPVVSNLPKPHSSSELQDIGDLTMAGAFVVQQNELVRILNDDKSSEWIEVQSGDYRRGFIARNDIEFPNNNKSINWTSWLDILLFGLIPWACFCPIVFLCLFASPKKLAIAYTPFCGEFSSQTEDSNRLSPLQFLLLCWLIVDIIALFVGINQSRHDFFSGVIPAAMLFGIAMSSHPFWRSIRESLEARIGLILFAFLTLGFAVFAIYNEPYRIVRYLLTDPLMHWGVETNLPSQYIFFCFAFIVLTLISFTGITESIQTKILAWREQHKRPKNELRSSSSTSLMRISREETTPMPYAPAISLIFLAAMSSAFIYYHYLPKITDDFTEVSLIGRYFQLANQSEPIYILSGENSQLCLSYRDCDPGYVCQNNRCQISTFSSYSLNVAKPISRTDMLSSLMTDNSDNPAFYIIPKDALFDINNACRLSQPVNQRHNLTIVDAQSSRLFLIANHINIQSINPLDQIFPQSVPDNATKLHIDLDDDISLEAFKIDKLDFEKSKSLHMTFYYRVKHEFSEHKDIKFSFEIGSRKLDFDRNLLGNYDETQLLAEDLVADSIEFSFSMLPLHGVLSVLLTTSQLPSQLKPLTTIDY